MIFSVVSNGVISYYRVSRRKDGATFDVCIESDPDRGFLERRIYAINGNPRNHSEIADAITKVEEQQILEAVNTFVANHEAVEVVEI